MYEDYFRFKQKPFSIAPDPSFLYLSERHREALAHLMYGLQTDGGFVLITGEVGTGKTTLVRSLIDSVPDHLDVAFVLNPRLTVSELLETLCDELGIFPRDQDLRTNKRQIDLLNKHLLKAHSIGRSTVVIIDEAQNLSAAVLEQIRLLTNLETNERKLLRIILLGQPELAELLDRREMRQLVQRVTARYHLAALGLEDTRAYIAHRLTLAGGNPHIFSRGACRAIFRLSGGIPRLINVLADRALLGAYVEGKSKVTTRIVRKAAREAFSRPFWTDTKIWLGSLVALLLTVGAAWAFWETIPGWRPLQMSSATSDSVATVVAPDPAVLEPTRAAAEPIDRSGLAEPVVANPIVDPQTQPQTPPTMTTVASVDPLARPADVASYQLQRDAYAAIFNRWGAAFDPNKVPCNQAPEAGLQCLKLNGSVSDVLRLNHIAVIELWDELPEPYYAAMLRHANDAFTIQLGSTRLEVSPQDLRQHWYGTYIVLWEMPPEYRGNLQIGDVGPGVAWLRQRLAATLQIDLRAPEPDGFDEGLQQALMRFQREHGLVPDGIAGPITWIAINSTSPNTDTQLSVAT